MSIMLETPAMLISVSSCTEKELSSVFEVQAAIPIIVGAHRPQGWEGEWLKMVLVAIPSQEEVLTALGLEEKDEGKEVAAEFLEASENRCQWLCLGRYDTDHNHDNDWTLFFF